MAHTAWSNDSDASGRLIAAEAGVHWQIAPEYRRLLLNDEGSLRIQEWLANSSATVFKIAPHRTIYRVQLGELDFYLKQYRAVGLRNRLREVIRSTKAKAEFDKTTALRQREIAVPRAIGWGRLGSSFAPLASFVFSETVQSARHLTDVLQDLTPRQRIQLAKTLGEYVAQLHAAGVWHRDFHPGNLLVRWDEAKAPEIVLIDLHEVQTSRPLSWRRRRENLCVFNRYFILRATRADRLRFWRAYVNAAGNAIPDDPQATATALEHATALSNLKFWSAREKKYLSDSRLVRRVVHAGICGFAVRDLSDDDLRLIAGEPDRWFEASNAVQLKAGGASSVALTPIGVLKRFNLREKLDVWKNMIRRSAALRSWVFGLALQDAYLPTAKLLTILHRDDGVEYLLTEALPGVVDLREFVDSANDRSRRKRIDVVARTLRLFHDRHFGHRDLKAGNLLTPADPNDHRVWFIDLVGVRRRRRVSRKRRVHDLARLAASFLNHPGLTQSDRLRFLTAYFGAANHSKAGWKRWWRELAEAAQAKVERTQSRGRPLG